MDIELILKHLNSEMALRLYFAIPLILLIPIYIKLSKQYYKKFLQTDLDSLEK
eukprot:COSAG01_NODE_2_length_63927_cov_1357.611941_32_plen_53_part_00